MLSQYFQHKTKRELLRNKYSHYTDHQNHAKNMAVNSFEVVQAGSDRHRGNSWSYRILINKAVKDDTSSQHVCDRPDRMYLKGITQHVAKSASPNTDSSLWQQISKSVFHSNLHIIIILLYYCATSDLLNTFQLPNNNKNSKIGIHIWNMSFSVCTCPA